MTYIFINQGNLTTKASKALLKKRNLDLLQSTLSQSTVVSNEKEYNLFLKQITDLLKKLPKLTLPNKDFDKELKDISKKLALTELTGWGGVSLKKVDVAKNYIRKLLVIKQHGILGFEIHKYKHERLKILEGLCLIFYNNHANKKFVKGTIYIKLATVNDTFTFLPGDEHGIIALSNSIIEEQSTNHLNDLIFIYNSKQVIA